MHNDVIMDSIEPPSRSSMLDEHDESDPYGCLDDERMFEPGPDDSHADSSVPSDEPDPDDSLVGEVTKSFEEPGSDHVRLNKIGSNYCQNMSEPDPDDSITTGTIKDTKQLEYAYVQEKFEEPDPDECSKEMVLKTGGSMEPCTQGLQVAETLKAKPDPDDNMGGLVKQELQRIEEPVAAICTCLKRAIEMLRSDIRNAIDRNEVKFRRLRKANPQFERNVANYKAAVEVLALAGFHKDVITDELGRAKTYMGLKRNDPGLLCLAMSSLDVSVVW